MSSAPTAAGDTGKGVPQAPATSAALPPAVRDVMLRQAPLAAAAERLRVVTEAGGSGLAGIGLKADGVVIWWHGAVPARVRAAAAAERVPVQLVAARHSRAQLERTAARITASFAADAGSPYWGVEVAADGSGITVNANPATASRVTDAAPAAWRVPADTKVAIEARAPLRTTSRLADTPPFWGGARIQNNDNSAFCTAGFAVSAGSTRSLLTAGHCGRVSGGWNNGNDSQYVGAGSRENVAHDLLLITTNSGGRIYDGGVGSGEFSKGVAGSGAAFPNQFLCTSGATTGAVCNFRVSSSFQFSYCGNDAYGNRECYSDLVTATQLDGRPGSQGGDSGGPVFSLSGTSNVIANGIISGAGGSTLVFQDWPTAQRDFGINILTG